MVTETTAIVIAGPSILSALQAGVPVLMPVSWHSELPRRHGLEESLTVMIQINDILLPTDFSEPSLTATQCGLELAKRFDAKLHLLHVIVDPVVYLPMFESFPLPAREEFEEYAQSRLEAWILPEDAADCEVVWSWVHGAPFVETLRHAKQHEIDLIVVGTHGWGIAKHLLMGSVAEKIVRKACCPVLTVRPDEHHFVHPGADE